MITVLVLHEASLVRSALENALCTQDDMEVRATGSTSQALAIARGTRPQVVVSHARSVVPPELRQALGRGGARYVVQVEAQHRDAFGDLLLDGASGLFSDRTASTEVVDAVRHVAAGRGWVSPELVPELVRDYLPYHRRRAEARNRLRDLGAAEVRLLALLAAGGTNAEIAAELHLAVSTVKDYVGGLLGRLGTTRSEAIALAVRADLPGSTRGAGP